MRSAAIAAAAFILLSPMSAHSLYGAEPIKVSNLALEGEIEGENIVFTLSFEADVNRRGAELPLVVGDVAFLDGDLPRRSTLKREANRYLIEFGSRGRHTVTFRFASRAAKNAEWRHTGFTIPSASIRKLSVICDRDDLKVRFPGALSVERETAQDGRTMVSAFLGISDTFRVSWKPEVKKLAADLAVSCEANTIATASVGALRLDTVLTYRVIQGAMTDFTLDLPSVNVTQVTGEDIQNWRIDRTDPQHPRLIVSLSRPKEDVYRLRVESEMILPAFPCGFDLPVIAPQNVIRSSGFLTIGADSAIKLSVDKVSGLTQIDRAAVPTVKLDADPGGTRRLPRRSTYAYQYAGMPYTLTLSADDVVTSFTADDRLVLSFENGELAFNASVEIDVKDAPAREVFIETDPDPGWTVTAITGAQVSETDTDVREEDGTRLIYVPFQQAVSGTVLINVRMERSLPKDATTFSAPAFKIRGAKAERGYVVAAAEKGIRLKVENVTGMREVFTGSAPMQVSGSQHAFRFKDPGWGLAIAIERALPSIHAEVFHLVSLGEGVMYCSAAITYHIGGAPIQELLVHIPQEIETVELTGADIEGWRREGETCAVRLQTRIMGDYTLLVTHDRQFDAEGAVIDVGGIETIGTESEVGYLAIASSASIRLKAAAPPPASIIRIDRDEIPTGYSSPVADPIIGSYRYVRVPHTVSMRVDPYATEQLLGQIADYVKLATMLTRNGEAVTTATYYIKNAVRQHLIARLPQGADLWSIKLVDENGRKRDVLSQQSEQGILIPVRRPRDPNTPLCVEVVYAQSHGPLGFVSSGLRSVTLEGPTLPDTHATFSGWTVDVPEDFAIASSGGNVASAAFDASGGLRSVIVQALQFLAAVRDGRGGATLREAFSYGQGHGRSVEFARTVDLAGSTPLAVSLRVVPAWIGSVGSVRLMIGATAVGALLIGFGAAARKRAFLISLGLTLLILGLTQVAAARGILAAVLALVVVIIAARLVYVCILCPIWRLLRRAAAGCARVRRARREARAVRREARADRRREREARRQERRARQEPSDDLPPLEPEPTLGEPAAEAIEEPRDTDSPASRGPASGTVASILLLCCLGAGLAAAAPAPPQTPPPAIAAPIMDSVELTIEGPGTGRDIEQSALVHATLRFQAEDPVSFVVAPPGFVLTESDPGSRYAEIEGTTNGYVLKVGSRDKYVVRLAYRLPVQEQDGQWSVQVPLLPNLRNKVILSLPEPELEIRSEQAVLLTHKSGDKTTAAEAVFGSSPALDFSWRPKVRKVSIEDAVFFCEVNTFVGLRSGVVDLTNLVRYQVARGEIKDLRLRIPHGMSVTAVSAPGLATWSFDPETRLLVALLEKPQSGNVTLTFVTQIPSEGPPYDVVIGAPAVLEASRQRGSIALAAVETVHVRVEETGGLSPMNIEDFSPAAITAASQGGRPHAAATIRKAFRYHEAEKVAASVHAERVLAELRVTESGALSIADERIVLATKLQLEIAKSGLFFATFALPVDFDVETLTGREVSHWDETTVDDPAMAAGGTGQVRRVVVHFKSQILGATEINLVIARTEKGIEEKILVPRVVVQDARKHNGRLTVSGERGVRMMIDSHQGVDVKKASEEGIRQAGILVFDILRPAWSIVLRTEVMAPLIKPRVLQWINLTEGMLQCRSYVRYRIENAGVKTFRIQSPLPGVSLSVAGAGIARVHEIDPAQGIWRVDLHNKVEKYFNMIASYQIPYDPAERRVELRPLRALDTDSQRGYLVVTCDGRVQVEPRGVLEGLKIEDPRSIPSDFGAGDLSNAIRCYRTVRPDYTLELSVVRHDSAAVLPASINRVHMISVASVGRKVLTRLSMEMTVGGLRFLKFGLPQKDDSLWTALVNGKEVQASRDGALYCIPLEELDGGQASAVELVYAGSSTSSRALSRQTYEAPRFEGLPLRSITWDFYAPPGMTYYGFGGTLEYEEDALLAPKRFNADDYKAWNKAERARILQKAREVLSTGEQLARAGRRKQAAQAFQQALNYSQGQADLNEDARVQLRNLQKQQVKMGLVNRRDAVRLSRNIIDEGQAHQMEGFQDGQYTEEYAQTVEQRLSAKDNTALEVVADKIIDQQAKAAGVVTAINITMPERGERLRFKRALRIDPKGDLTVSFRVLDRRVAGLGNALWPMVILFALLWFATAHRVRRRAARANGAQ